MPTTSRFVALAVFAAGCSSNEGAEPTKTTEAPLLTVVAEFQSKPLELIEGPTVDNPSWFGAARVVAGQDYWTGQGTVAATAGPVEIIDAEVVATDDVEPVGVFVGLRNVQGTPGATAGHFPGDGSVAEGPDPAVGTTFPADGSEWVVYAVGQLRDGATSGVIYGTRLTVRSGQGHEKVIVFIASPTFLCPRNAAEDCEDYGQFETTIVDDLARAIEGTEA